MEYWALRATDARAIRLTNEQASKVFEQTLPARDSEYLSVFHVPTQYCVRGEQQYRIEVYGLEPVWDWGRGIRPKGITEMKQLEEELNNQ